MDTQARLQQRATRTHSLETHTHTRGPIPRYRSAWTGTCTHTRAPTPAHLLGWDTCAQACTHIYTHTRGSQAHAVHHVLAHWVHTAQGPGEPRLHDSDSSSRQPAAAGQPSSTDRTDAGFTAGKRPWQPLASPAHGVMGTALSFRRGHGRGSHPSCPGVFSQAGQHALGQRPCLPLPGDLPGPAAVSQVRRLRRSVRGLRPPVWLWVPGDTCSLRRPGGSALSPLGT